MHVMYEYWTSNKTDQNNWFKLYNFGYFQIHPFYSCCVISVITYVCFKHSNHIWDYKYHNSYAYMSYKITYEVNLISKLFTIKNCYQMNLVTKPTQAKIKSMYNSENNIVERTFIHTLMFSRALIRSWSKILTPFWKCSMHNIADFITWRFKWS